MVPDLLCSTLLLLGILGLCASVIWVWRRRHAATSHATTRAPRRSPAHTPWPGLTPKPSCAAGEDGPQEQVNTRPSAPAPRVTRRGWPRTVDTPYPFGPRPHGASYGGIGVGNVRANGHPRGGRWRQLQCVACGTYFRETPGTPSPGTRAAPALLGWAVTAWAAGLGGRAVARVCEVAPHTVRGWLVEAADHLQPVSRHVRHDVHVTQGQLDELCARRSAVNDGAVTETDARQRRSRSPQWVWVAMAPVTKLRLTMNVGEPSLAMAPCAVQQVAPVVAPDCGPLVLTDGVTESTTALLTHVGQWRPRPRRQPTGPVPQPRWMPPPPLR
jgi:hypothetical protein